MPRKPTQAQIRALRRKTGLNTRDFGQLVGKSGRTVEGWEQGRYPISSDTWELLGIKVAALE